MDNMLMSHLCPMKDCVVSMIASVSELSQFLTNVGQVGSALIWEKSLKSVTSWEGLDHFHKVNILTFSVWKFWKKWLLFIWFTGFKLFGNFYPLTFQAERVLSLPASVRLSVRPSVRLSVRPWTFPCPHDNASHIWARITKFAPNMHPGILLSGIENRGHWPWTSMSFGHFDLEF